MPPKNRALLPLVLGLLLAAPAARAQQFFTDVAALPAERSCMLDAWYGQHAAWVQPACHFLPSIELRAGAGWLVPPQGALEPAQGRSLDWVVQGKIVFQSVQDAPVGVGLVIGGGTDRLSQVLGYSSRGAYAYLPVSLALMKGGQVVLHGNVGWRFQNQGLQRDTLPGLAQAQHFITWGARIDVAPIPYVAAVGEVFADTSMDPVYQVGLSLSPLPRYVRLRLTYGGGLLTQGWRPGWAAGVLITPPSFW